MVLLDYFEQSFFVAFECRGLTAVYQAVEQTQRHCSSVCVEEFRTEGLCIGLSFCRVLNSSSIIHEANSDILSSGIAKIYFGCRYASFESLAAKLIVLV